MKIKLLFSALTFYLLLACSKDKNEIISISGITERDNTGGITGTVDETDWRDDSFLPDNVTSLFNFSSDVDYTNAKISSIAITEYPNPVSDFFMLNFYSAEETVVRIIIVDESLKVYLQYADHLNSGEHMLNINAANILSKNKYYRVYYAFYDSSKAMYYKGHGDIKTK